MSELTSTWTVEKIREIYRKLDEKTGLKGAEQPISFFKGTSWLGYYRSGSKTYFKFNKLFLNDPETKEAAVIELLRHEYAHYYDHSALRGVKGCICNGDSHGPSWQWACKKVGVYPNAKYWDGRYKDSKWTVAQAEAAYNAEDIEKLDIFSYTKRWGHLPVDIKYSSKLLATMQERNPDAYYEVGQEILHPKRGFGKVCDTTPFDYDMQELYVRFEDGSDGVFPANELCKMIDGVAVQVCIKNRLAGR